VVIDVVVVDLFVFDCSLLSVVNGLQLMPIGDVSVMRGRHYVVLIVSLSGQKLMLGCGLEMMGSSAVVYGRVVMHFMLSCCGHGFSPNNWQRRISLPRTGYPNRVQLYGRNMTAREYSSKKPEYSDLGRCNLSLGAADRFR